MRFSLINDQQQPVTVYCKTIANALAQKRRLQKPYNNILIKELHIR